MSAAAIDRHARLEETLRELERRFGEAVVYRLSQARPKLGERVVSTGSIALDHATGIGVVPRGRISTIDGPESTGKSTIAYHILASAQRDRGLAALIDVEQAIDPTLLVGAGASLDDLLLGIPTDPLEALAQAEVLARSATLDAIVVLGFGGQIPRQLVTDAARRIVGAIAGTPTALVYVGMAPRYTSGQLLASLGIALRPLGLLTRAGGEVIGLRVGATIAASKLGPPGALAEIAIVDGRGIWRAAELLRLGLRLELIAQREQGFVYADTLLGRGPLPAMEALDHDPALAAALANAVSRGLERQ